MEAESDCFALRWEDYLRRNGQGAGTPTNST